MHIPKLAEQLTLSFVARTRSPNVVEIARKRLLETSKETPHLTGEALLKQRRNV